MEIFGIEVVECEEAGDAAFLLPTVHPVVYEPVGGFASDAERRGAEMDAITEAYVQAAKRGEVGVIKNVRAR